MNLRAMQQAVEDNGQKWTIYPTCAGTSVFAIRYNGGVVLAADTNVSYGKMSRYNNFGRCVQISSKIAVVFSGDHADFQFLKSLIDYKFELHKKEMNDYNAEISPYGLYNWLCNFLYYRRSRINPLANTILIAGTETNYQNKDPLLGHINMRGVGYFPKYIATGMSAMLLQQTMENTYRAANGDKFDTKFDALLTKEQAIELMNNCIEIAQYRDCNALPNFTCMIVDNKDGISLLQPKPAIGKWKAIANNTLGYD